MVNIMGPLFLVLCYVLTAQKDVVHGGTKTTNLNCLTRGLIDARSSHIYTGLYILITVPAESGKLAASAQPYLRSEVSRAAKIHS